MLLSGEYATQSCQHQWRVRAGSQAHNTSPARGDTQNGARSPPEQIEKSSPSIPRIPTSVPRHPGAWSRVVQDAPPKLNNVITAPEHRKKSTVGRKSKPVDPQAELEKRYGQLLGHLDT